MDSIEQMSLRIRKNLDDLEAWESLLALVDDPQKKRDCQAQIDRIIVKQSPAIVCPQCGAGMQIYFSGEMHDKRAKCPYCGTDIDIPDSYSKTVVEKHTGFGDLLPETDVTVYERRADNAGATITSGEINQLVMEKGLAAARQELQARGIQGIQIGDASGMQMPAEARKILEEEGAQALAKSHGAIMLSGKQANSMIKGILAFFIVLMLIGIVLALVQIFLK